MKIGSINLAPAFGLAPMAGMTDTAFRRLVKRRGGCGLVVTEMVSSEGLVRGIDRTLEYAEYTEEERPVSIQIFGGEPEKMAAAAQIVEGMGADIVDVNMGCPVPKIAKHNAGCSLMREPAHAQAIVSAMAKAVKIPVTVKMRAGWDESEINAPELARRMEDAGRGRAHRPRPHRGAVLLRIVGLGADRSRRREPSGFPCSAAGTVSSRRSSCRSCWTAGFPASWSAAAPCGIPGSSSRPRRWPAARRRARSPSKSAASSCWTTSSCCCTSAPVKPRVSVTSRRSGDRAAAPAAVPARGHDRWVINKLRALNSWYTKGLDNGSHLRVSVNAAESIPHLREIIAAFFSETVAAK